MTWPAGGSTIEMLLLVALLSASEGLPEWPLASSRFILNPQRGSSIKTATCAAYFSTPCAIEKVHQIVYEVASRLESCASAVEVEQVIVAVNAQEYNHPISFWPTVIDANGTILATGVELSAQFEGAGYVGRSYDAAMTDESGGRILIEGLFSRVQMAADPSRCLADDTFNCEGYFISSGYDGYHGVGVPETAKTRTPERVNYVMRVSTPRGELYVTSAYSNMAYSTTDATGDCTADRDGLCSIALARRVLGNVLTDAIKAPTQDTLNNVFAAVTNEQYNSFYQGQYTGFYPFIWGMSGRGYAHGANPNQVGTYLNSSARVQIPILTTLHYDLAAAGASGGGWVAYYWWNNAGEEPYLKVSFTVGFRRFGKEYYVGVGFTHETDALANPRRGPHNRDCMIGTNQPCAFVNVLDLVGHIQASGALS